MKYFLTALALAIFLISGLASVASADLGYYCQGNNSFYNWTEDGVFHNLTVPCAHGCDSGECLTDAAESPFTVAYVITYVIIAFIMAYLAMNIDREAHGHIEILFLFLSLFTSISAIVGVQSFIDLQGIPLVSNTNVTLITVFVWTSFFILGYLIIIFLHDLVVALNDKVMEWKASKRGGLPPRGRKR